MYLQLLCGLLLSLFVLTACIPEPLDKALSGQLSPEESNTVITAYCQSCHIHRAFEPPGHPPERVRALYDRLPYTVTNQCRACHLAREDTWEVRHRKTAWPADVAQNRYKAFERRFLAENPDLRKAVDKTLEQ